MCLNYIIKNQSAAVKAICTRKSMASEENMGKAHAQECVHCVPQYGVQNGTDSLPLKSKIPVIPLEALKSALLKENSVQTMACNRTCCNVVVFFFVASMFIYHCILVC